MTTERPDRSCFNDKRANEDAWVNALALRYVGDCIVYLADVLKEGQPKDVPLTASEVLELLRR